MQTKKRKVKRTFKTKQQQATPSRSKKSKKEILNLFLETFESILGPFLTTLVKRKITSHSVPKTRFDPILKNISIGIFMRCHRGIYEYLCELLPLPKISTIDKWLRRMRAEPGINEDVFDLLKIKLEDNHKRGLCTMVVDELSIRSKLEYDVYSDKIIGLDTTKSGKEAAVKKVKDCNSTFKTTGQINSYKEKFDSSVVCKTIVMYMLQGLDEKWKMPIGYSVVPSAIQAEDLKEDITEYVNAAEESGATVKAISSDLGQNFSRFFRLNGATNEKPVITLQNSDNEDRKIIIIRDLSHLMKCSRNLLCKEDIKVPEYTSKASWSHLKEFFNKNEIQPSKLPTKLKEHFLNKSWLQGRNKMKAGPAFKTLSASVASGLCTFVTKGLLEKAGNDALATASYCEKLNEIGDILNCQESNNSSALRRPLTKDSRGLKKLKSSVTWFKELKRINYKPKRKLYHIDGWIQTVSGTILLQECLEKEHEIKSLKTRNTTSDAIENLFSRFRSIHK